MATTRPRGPQRNQNQNRSQSQYAWRNPQQNTPQRQPRPQNNRPLRPPFQVRPSLLNTGGAGARNQNTGYYRPPPPPRPPRPPQPVSFMRPLSAELPLPPGVSDSESASSYPPANPQHTQSGPGHLQSSPHPPPPPPPPQGRMINPNGAYVPLAPPPLPPLFPYLSQELAQSLHDGASECGKSFVEESVNLPFVPVIVNDVELKQLSESVKIQFEEQQKEVNLLLYEDIIDPTLPKGLKDLFQPLYCKLCQLTLSSPVVARDHYKGKRHMRAIELWMQDNPSKFPQNNSFGGGNTSGLIQGIIKPAGSHPGPPIQSQEYRGNGPATYPNQHGYDRTPAPPPPYGNQNSNFKRNASGIILRQNQPEVIPAYRAALATPGPARKKPKVGGNYTGYCNICDVNHTSIVTAEQHYRGKHHKAKVEALQSREQQYLESNSTVANDSNSNR